MARANSKVCGSWVCRTHQRWRKSCFRNVGLDTHFTGEITDTPWVMKSGTADPEFFTSSGSGAICPIHPLTFSTGPPHSRIPVLPVDEGTEPNVPNICVGYSLLRLVAL